MLRRHLLALALFATPALLAADTFPSQERGFQAEKAFQLGDFDSVNLFNGSTTLTINLGAFPVGGNLSYGLSLYYSSNTWDFQQDGSGLYTQGLPNRRSNSGTGWRLSLGELIDPNDPDNDTDKYVYVDPSGAEHIFYPVLHEGEAAAADLQYTRDDSYLRLRLSSGLRRVEFPDGNVQKFVPYGNWDWNLSQLTDRFGNWVQVNPVYNPQTGKLMSWTITDQHNRTQTVNFVPVTQLGVPAGGVYDVVVSSVVLTAFGGQTATYTFNYAAVTIPRPCKDNDPATGATVTVPLLTEVQRPDGSRWLMPFSDYYLDSTAGCGLAGILKAITTPLLGRIEWVYGGYAFPTDTDEKPWRDFSNGVYSRTLKNSAGAIQGTWTYSPSLNPLPGPNTPAREAIRTVKTPLGDKTDSYFSVALDESGGWTQFEYGLPFSRFDSDGAGRFLSTRAYDCDAAGNNCVLKRSTYVAYERDAGFFSDFQLNMDRNRRVSATRTTYHDDGGRHAAESFSSFDGLGHYRNTVLSGDFDAGNTASLFTNYNPTRGIYPGSFTMLSSSDPWVLGTYNEQTRTEGGFTAKTEHCFDTSTGFLLRTRTLTAGTAQGVIDLVVQYTHTAGNLTREEYFGGDVQNPGTGALCGLALPANQYRIDHVWDYGVRKSAQYYNANGTAISFKSLDTDIDAFSGLVLRSRDTSGIVTNYNYDALGRLTDVKPETGHDGWTQYVYTRAINSSNPAQVQILRKTNGGGTVLTESLVKYDSFGRVWQEQIRMPDTSWSTKETLYNALGWKTFVSEQGNTAKKTQFLSYDPFGRPAMIRPPDGATHDVTFSYLGVRQVSRTSKVGNTYSGGVVNEVLSTTQEIYDRQGRLFQVLEQAEASGANTTTTYFYVVGNRLSRVQQATSAGTQNRWFNYDNRGFLTSEQHPEKGTSGNGTVSYTNYDARGHAHNKSDGPHNLSFVYDRAERLTDVSGNGGQLLKKFIYGTSNAAGVRTNGRLEQATRYNYVGSPFNATVQITETYTYGGRQGRGSRRNTQMTYNGTPSESFVQTWTWNELGDPSALGYPECTFAGCTPVPRSVTNTYTNGFLTSVPNWASSITYHANGMVNQATHSNTVVDTQANDPNMMSRPSLISAAKGTTTLWSSGTYQYDGSGNVVKTGNGYFLYDRVSRLIEGRVYDGPTGGGTQKWQSYTFDPFGNIQMIGGTSGRATPTSSATNRLNGTGTVYDSAGNLTNWNGNVYEYDRFNQMTRMVSGSEDWRYVYTAGDERFWTYRVGGGGSLWALRDLDGRLLREYEAHTSWSTFKDYIHRGSQLLASAHSTEGIKHFHLDHLGTPRLVTATGGGGDFYTLTPCRVIDTRDQSAPINAGETRTVTMVGACGIPSNATAVSVNLTVVGPSSQGELTAFPANESRPVASAISYQAGVVRANNGILKLGNGALAFYANQPSGNVHLIVDVNGYFVEEARAVLAYHVYYPFGEEATAFNQDAEQMKFTGHERDLASFAGAGDDLDYMHVRHCSPLTGRFHSVDPAMESADPFTPQSWNRYNYVQNNPLVYVDPTGELLVFAGGSANLEKLRKLVNDSLHGYELVINKNGTAQLVSTNVQGPASPEQAALAGALSAAINRSEVVRIGVEASATDVLIGDYATERIDVQDLGAIGSGPGVSGASALAHEVVEQTARQVFNFQNTRGDFERAHLFGIAAQNAVSGFTRGRSLRLLPSAAPYTGTTVTQQARGSRLITVVMFWDNGNLVRVLRQEP